jgi:hypothetical protein
VTCTLLSNKIASSLSLSLAMLFTLVMVFLLVLSVSSNDERGIPLLSLAECMNESRLRLVPLLPKVRCALLFEKPRDRDLLLPVEEDSPIRRGAKCLKKRRNVARQQHMMRRFASTKLLKCKLRVHNVVRIGSQALTSTMILLQ